MARFTDPHHETKKAHHRGQLGRRTPSRRKGVAIILFGVVYLVVGAALLRYMIRGGAAPYFFNSPSGLLAFLMIVLPHVGMALMFIAIGVSAFYYPRWARRIAAPRVRALRTWCRERHGQQFIRDLESEDWRVRLRTTCWYFPRSFRHGPPFPGAAWLRQLAATEFQTILIVFVIPIMLFTAAGLALPTYSGPQPPTTAIEWAHQTATRIAQVMFSGAAPHIPLILAAALLLYLWSRRLSKQSDSGPHIEGK